ncbi:hypothetical protein FV139_08130 [Parahaliea maris]|uniref:Uncharacterized protein n=1 Tax=Parahaliea maris TaxID=2716870 RepID=A0A5C9A742_9GAMM|nr:hypothetical protein [Parahaliea maris]TXS95822.1 hypothetical protein FV139_08130 [Parahaliea maris]
MIKPLLLSAVAFVAVLVIVAALTVLTGEEETACSSTERDVGAAVLADDTGDQDALVNRAIIVRGKCEQDEKN